MKVLSLFDGISCGYLALKRAGIPIDTYYASEIDSNAIKVSKYHFPEINRLGDVRKVPYFGDLDLIIGGSPCFAEDTMIICEDEIKPISKVEVGDMVLTHNLRYRKVLKTMNHLDEIFLLKSQSNLGTLVTKNHPYYTRTRYRSNNKWCFNSPTWSEVEELSKSNYLATPILPDSKNPMNITKDEAFVIGLYIGDGHLKDNFRTEQGRSKDRQYQLIISVGNHEVEKFQYAVNLKYSLYPSTDSCHSASFSNKRLVEYAKKNCGCGARNKFLSKNILNLPVDLLKQVIEGYLFADGSYRNNTYRAGTISKRLIESLILAIAKVYHTTSTVEFTKRPKSTMIEGRLVNQSDTYTISFRKKHPKQSNAWVLDNYIWNPFKSLDYFDIEKVYNLEVEEDNSYVANNQVVHNCVGFSNINNLKYRKNFEHDKSKLFFDFVAILEAESPRYFLLENVAMKQEWLDIITSYMGVEPVKIDSALVSPQSRTRYYWTNIDFEMPEDHGIGFRETFKANPAYIKTFDYKEPVLLTREKDKAYSVTTHWSTMIMSFTEPGIITAYDNRHLWRTGTVEERCILQTLPKDFLNLPGNEFYDEMSVSVLFKMLGNCWTVDVIKYILKGLINMEGLKDEFS